MSTTAPPPTSNQPLGATGDQRHRFLLHHVALALVSAGVFVLWMTLAIFRTDPAARTASVQSLHGAGGHHGPTGPGGHHGPDHHGPTQAMPGLRMEWMALQNRMFIARATTASGYIGLGLTVFTLLIGPANLLLRRRNPVSGVGSHCQRGPHDHRTSTAWASGNGPRQEDHDLLLHA